MDLRARFPGGVGVTLYADQPGEMMDAAVRFVRQLQLEGVRFEIVDLARKARPLRLPQDLHAFVTFNCGPLHNVLFLPPERLPEHAHWAEHAFAWHEPLAVLLRPTDPANLAAVKGALTPDDLPCLRPIAPRIAVLLRGPIRPSVAAVAGRMAGLASQFEPLGVVDRYIATWRQEPEALAALQEAGMVLMYDQPTPEFVSRYVTRERFPPGMDRPTINAFWQFYMCGQAINDVCRGSPDFIVHARTDAHVILGNPEDWLVKGVFNTWHALRDMGTHINDQFAIADAETMRLAWDYGSLERLGGLLDEVYMPEDILQRNIDAAGIGVVRRSIELHRLDASR